MTQKIWSLGIKLFHNVADSVLLSERLKTSSSDAERVLTTIGKIFSRHLDDQFSQKLTPHTLLHADKFTSVQDLAIELEFSHDNKQQSLAFDVDNNTVANFFEAALLEAAEVIDNIFQINPHYPEQVVVSAKPSKNGLQTKSLLCAELVNKLRRTSIKTEPLTFVFPSGKTLEMHLKRIQNHSFITSEKTLNLTGRIVDFSDIDQVFKLQENGLRLVHKILLPSLSIETRDNLLDCFKAHDLITIKVTPRHKLVSGAEEPNDYEFIDFSVAQQKIA